MNARKLAWSVGGVTIVTTLAVSGMLWTAPGSSTDQRTIEIAPGTAFQEIVSMLASEGLLEHPTLFTAFARVTGQDRKIIPGEYRFDAGMSPVAILSHLVHGRVLLHPITIPEGYTMAQIAGLLEKHQLADRDEFLRACRDPSLIRDLSLDVPSLEGYLFPDTYFLTKNMSARDMIRTFVRRFHDVFTEDLRARAREIGMTVQEVLTLASVIEKETSLDRERALISGVFHNRLHRRMPLQSDPTVIYALKDFDGNLRKRDLVLDSPYNTYRVLGLPPGPIANPGKASILAALYPAHTDYVYFVSRNDGSHQFSVTLAEHNAAVQRFQRSADKQAS